MNKRGQLSLVGIVAVIILLELLIGYFTFAVTNESVKNVFVSNCECNYVGGCSAYVAVNGVNALIDKCETQAQSNVILSDALSNRFFNMTIVLIIIFVINIILIFVIILVIRGISG